MSRSRIWWLTYYDIYWRSRQRCNQWNVRDTIQVLCTDSWWGCTNRCGQMLLIWVQSCIYVTGRVVYSTLCFCWVLSIFRHSRIFETGVLWWHPRGKKWTSSRSGARRCGLLWILLCNTGYLATIGCQLGSSHQIALYCFSEDHRCERQLFAKLGRVVKHTHVWDSHIQDKRD